MRHLFSLILFLFCTTALFAQNDNDTSTITLKEVTIRSSSELIPQGTICIIRRKEHFFKGCFALNTVYIVKPSKIVHTNHSEFGLTIIPAFRFESVDRMANTVAGVLCY